MCSRREPRAGRANALAALVGRRRGMPRLDSGLTEYAELLSPIQTVPSDGNLMTIHPPRGCLCLICMSSQSRNFFGGVSPAAFHLFSSANWIPVWRAQPTTPSVALGAAQFLARSRNMSGGPYGGGSSLATVRAPARRARAMRPPSRNIIARRRAQLCSPRSNGEDERSAWRDIRTRARVLVPRSLPDVACAPRSPSRPLSRAFPRHPDSDSPASPDSPSRQFMRVGAVVVGLGYGAVMGTFTGLVC